MINLTPKSPLHNGEGTETADSSPLSTLERGTGGEVSPVTDEIAENLLIDLVSTASPSHEENDAVQLLVNWMRENGYDNAYIDEAGNAVGIIGNGEQDVILLGHIDTFGGFPEIRTEGRLFYGRGSVDAKGSLCTFASAGARANLPDNIRLIVIGAVEEEAPSSKGARYVATQFNPSACIIGEPSNWDRITLGYKGRLVLQYRWYGALAHSANSVLTPAEHAINYWNRVQAYVSEYNGEETRIFGTLDATVQDLNTAQHGAFGEATMIVGFRLPPGCDAQELADALADDDEHVSIRAYGMETAYVGDRDSVLSRALRGAIRSQDGKPRFVHKTGTSDMNVVANHWDCPMVAYGPGDSALDHTPDEHIDLDEYLSAVRVLTTALERLNI